MKFIYQLLFLFGLILIIIGGFIFFNSKSSDKKSTLNIIDYRVDDFSYNCNLKEKNKKYNLLNKYTFELDEYLIVKNVNKYIIYEYLDRKDYQSEKNKEYKSDVKFDDSTNIIIVKEDSLDVVSLIGKSYYVVKDLLKDYTCDDSERNELSFKCTIPLTPDDGFSTYREYFVDSDKNLNVINAVEYIYFVYNDLESYNNEKNNPTIKGEIESYIDNELTIEFVNKVPLVRENNEKFVSNIENFINGLKIKNYVCEEVK